MKIKKLLSVFILLICIIVLSSCNKKTPTLMDYNDVYPEISLEEQKDIEDAYYDTFGEKIKWSMPNRNINKFKNVKQLDDYLEQNGGIRPYYKNDEYILLAKYGLGRGWLSVTYLIYGDFDNIILRSNEYVGRCTLLNLYVYKDNKLLNFYDKDYEVLEIDIKEMVDITLDEAMKLRQSDNKYNETFYKKFLTDEEIENNDYRSFYDRLRYSLEKVDKKPTSTKEPEPVDTTYRPTGKEPEPVDITYSPTSTKEPEPVDTTYRPTEVIK